MKKYTQKLEIDIYYLTKKVKNLEKLHEKDTLKSILKNKDEFISFAKNLKTKGGVYEEFYGSISIKLNYKQIIKKQYYDDICTLICYFLNSIEECINLSKSEFYYPESPIKIKLHSKNSYLYITFNEKTHKIDEKIFYETILEKAKTFFEILVYDLGLSSYLLEIDKIKKLGIIT